MNQTFRLRPGVKYQGMACTAFFLVVVALYSGLFFLDDPTEYGFKGKRAAAIMGGMGLALFGTMLALSVYAWAAYYIERFTIAGTTIALRTGVQNHVFEASDVRGLRWRVLPSGGGILLRGVGFRARLDLAGYLPDDRLGIIRGLRRIVPEHVQEGWPVFCYKIALPLRGDDVPASRPAPEQCCTITRGRYDRMLAVALPTSVVGTVAAGVWLGWWGALVLPALVVAGWLMLRFQVPREGRSEPKVTATEVGRTAIFGWSAIVGSNLLMIAMALAGFERPIPCYAGCAVLLAALPPLLYRLYRQDRLRQAAEAQGALVAEAQWTEGEDLESIESEAIAGIEPATSAALAPQGWAAKQEWPG